MPFSLQENLGRQNSFDVLSSTEFMSKLEAKLKDLESDLSHLPAEKQYQILAEKAGVTHPNPIIPAPTETKNELLQQLKESKEKGIPLTIKFGIDPTGPDIHIGHAVSLLMVKRLMRMGHTVELIVGDFTAKIGDPTDRASERQALSDEQIRTNMQSYFDQAARIINLQNSDKVKQHFNSEWLNAIPLSKWMEILLQQSVNQALNRKDFHHRIATGGSVSIGELMYSLLMAYDSCHLKPDIEIGGMDQYLNLLKCREIMSLYDLKPETFIAVDLIPGTTSEMDQFGRPIKMSKSKGNYIAMTEDPAEMYAKTMSIPDSTMWTWFMNFTEISAAEISHLRKLVEIGKVHPKTAKQLLARTIVFTFHYQNEETVAAAEKLFNSKFGEQAVLIPEDITTVAVEPGTKLLDVLNEQTGESKGQLKKNASGVKVLTSEETEYVSLTVSELQHRTIEQGEQLYVRFGRKYYCFQA